MEKRTLLALALSFAVLGFYPLILQKFYPDYFKEIGLNLDTILQPVLKSFYNFTDRKKSAFVIKYGSCRSDKVVYQALLLYKHSNIIATDIESHFLNIFQKAFDIVLSQNSKSSTSSF